MMKCTLAALAAAMLAIAPQAHALEKVEGKVYKFGSFQHGTWPSTVLSNSCEKPHYLQSGILQGVWYQEGWYCVNLSVLRIRPYVPRDMRGTAPWNKWMP